jgi:uncharacterized protein (DUF169 family)
VRHKKSNDTLKECSDKIEHLLKLFTPPIGVKLVKSTDELPEDAQRTDRKCTVCQLVAFTRMDIKFQDKVIYATVDDILCALGGSALGFYERLKTWHLANGRFRFTRIKWKRIRR